MAATATTRAATSFGRTGFLRLVRLPATDSTLHRIGDRAPHMLHRRASAMITQAPRFLEETDGDLGHPFARRSTAPASDPALGWRVARDRDRPAGGRGAH